MIKADNIHIGTYRNHPHTKYPVFRLQIQSNDLENADKVTDSEVNPTDREKVSNWFKHLLGIDTSKLQTSPRYLDLVTVHEDFQMNIYCVHDGEVTHETRLMQSHIAKLASQVPENGCLQLLDDPERENSYNCEIWQMDYLELQQFVDDHKDTKETQAYRTEAGSLMADSPLMYRTITVTAAQALGREIAKTINKVAVDNFPPPQIGLLIERKKAQLVTLKSQSEQVQKQIDHMKSMNRKHNGTMFSRFK